MDHQVYIGGGCIYNLHHVGMNQRRFIDAACYIRGWIQGSSSSNLVLLLRCTLHIALLISYSQQLGLVSNSGGLGRGFYHLGRYRLRSHLTSTRMMGTTTALASKRDLCFDVSLHRHQAGCGLPTAYR
jgi:hypothetical protein